jgi:ATP-dependent phosphofructokinase / diphosphate-dependent phosphofructokinase
MKRIAVLTGGGDAPGLNAVIRAVVKTAILKHHCTVLGVLDGYDGFLAQEGIIPLDMASVRGILPRGGTILGTANRGNPFARKVMRDCVETIIDVSDKVVAAINKLELDAVIVIGGDGTLRVSQELLAKGVPVVGVPKTIDNDVGGTEMTFGFDTAMTTATEALDKLHTTAEAHHRVMVLELMGREAGFIALQAGVAGGADVILIPEIPFTYDAIIKKIHQRAQGGSKFSLLAVSEGARLKGGQALYARSGDEVYVPRLGGIGLDVGNHIENHGYEARVTVLGHLQRGGSPTPFDRWLASRFGAMAVRLASEKRIGEMAALKDGQVVGVSLSEALAIPKRVDVNGDGVRTARGLGISLGDE